LEMGSCELCLGRPQTQSSQSQPPE
jgi:hypothetical protein